jgi:hypothetical protein
LVVASPKKEMVFKIKYQAKRDALSFHSNFAKSFYVRGEKRPLWSKVIELVDQMSDGDFVPQTIEVEECLGFDPEEMIKAGMIVQHVEF